MSAWASIYTVTMSALSMGAVLYMGRITKRQRQQMNAMRSVMMATVCGASNMWDTLTPEQIRSLHPNTVEVGNGLPKWGELMETAEAMRFQMRSEIVTDDG